MLTERWVSQLNLGEEIMTRMKDLAQQLSTVEL
jgi:hypothetical protein